MRHDQALQHAIRQGWEVRHDGGDGYSACFGGARYLRQDRTGSEP